MKIASFKDVHIDLILARIWLKLGETTNFGAQKSFLMSRIMFDEKTTVLKNIGFQQQAAACTGNSFFNSLSHSAFQTTPRYLV